MALKDTYKTLRNLLEGTLGDLDKAEAGNKAAAQRVRTQTIKLEKCAKTYRKESVKADKNGFMKKAKEATRKTSGSKTSAPAKSSGTKHPPAPPATKKRAPAKKTVMEKKRPTAKLPSAGKKKR